jgi:hypothetical protein
MQKTVTNVHNRSKLDPIDLKFNGDFVDIAGLHYLIIK